MKKFFAFVFVAMIICFSVACNRVNPSSSISNRTDHIQTSSSTAENLPNEAFVHIDYAKEDLLAHPETFDEFIADESEYQVKVVFTTDTAIKDFKYVELSFNEAPESGKSEFTVTKELYSLAELSPNRPLVIGMTFEGIIPNRGISFIDENGKTKYYTIQMSGKDGSLFLTAF